MVSGMAATGRVDAIERLFAELVAMGDVDCVQLDDVGWFNKLRWPEYSAGETVLVPGRTEITFLPNRELLRLLDPSREDDQLPPDLGEAGHRPWIGELSRDARRLLVAGRNVNLGVVGTLRIVRAGERPPKPPWLDDDPDFDMLAEPLSTIHYTMSAELHNRLS
jgi:hypothetical protein